MTISTTPSFIPIPTAELSTGQDIASDPWRAATTDLNWLFDHHSSRSPVKIFDPGWWTTDTSYTQTPDDPSRGRGSTLSLDDIMPTIRPRRAVADSNAYIDSILLKIEIEASESLIFQAETQRIDGTGQSTTRSAIASTTLGVGQTEAAYVVPLQDVNDRPLTLDLFARSDDGSEQLLKGIWMYEPVPAVAQYPTQFTP